MCGRKSTKVWDISGEEPIYMGEFESQKAASDFTGVSKGKISQCVSGQKNLVKGMRFIEELSRTKGGLIWNTAECIRMMVK